MVGTPVNDMQTKYGDFVGGAQIQSNWGDDVNVTLDDKISKTDTANQAIVSNLDVVAGKVIATNTVNEKTPAAGVTVDTVLIKDNSIGVDIVTEKTPAAGVTVDSLLIKDGQITDYHVIDVQLDETEVATGGGTPTYAGLSGSDTTETTVTLSTGEIIRSKETYAVPLNCTKVVIQVLAREDSANYSLEFKYSLNGGTVISLSSGHGIGTSYGWISSNELTVDNNDTIRILITGTADLSENGIIAGIRIKFYN